MSYGLPALASDIDAHKEIGLRPKSYFATGDIGILRLKMEMALSDREIMGSGKYNADIVAKHYSWDTAVAKTATVFGSCFND